MKFNNGMKLSGVLALAFCLSPSGYAAPGLTFSGSTPKSIQFVDSKGDLWGTDNSWLNGPVGDDARKIVKFSGVAGGSAIVYQSSYTELLKPKGSDLNFNNGHPAESSYSVIRDIWPLPDGNVIFSTMNGWNNKGYLYKLRPGSSPGQDKVGNNAPAFDNRQAVMNIGERNGVQPGDIRTLHQASLSVATLNGATVLFFGEYNVNPNRISAGNGDWVGLWKSTDMGDTWSKVIEWNTNGHQTAHLHGVRYNPYNQWVYLLFGDTDAESGIVAWDGLSAAPPANTPLSQMGAYPGWKSVTGSQTVRAGDIVFTPTQCVWIPDVDEVPPGGLFGQRANHDLSGHVATGAVPYTNRIPPILGYRDASSGNIFWTSFWIAGASEQKLHLWTSNDSGSTWGLAAKVNNYPNDTAIANSLFKAPWGELVLSGVLGVDFTPPPSGQLPPAKGSAAFFGIGAPAVNTAPVANNDSATTTKGQAVTINVLSNDTDAQSNIAPATVTIGTPPQNGSVVVNANGAVVYTPASLFTGTNTFTYTVKDTLGLVSNVAQVQVAVTAASAVNDSYVVTADLLGSQFINVLAENGVGVNDVPSAVAAGRTFGTDWNLVRIGGTGTGTIALDYFDSNDGRFNYILTAPASANTDAARQAAKRGTYQFSYTLTVNGVTTLPATVTITVN
jgi:hypothetical protein